MQEWLDQLQLGGMGMYEIKKGPHKIAVKLGIDDIKDGLNFFTADDDFIQVGGWRYPEGKKLLAHKHRYVPRQITHTQEIVFVVSGGLKAFIYDDDDSFLEDIVLAPGEAIILFRGGHGYEVIENDTVVLEIKNGPYSGADIDRRRLEVK